MSAHRREKNAKMPLIAIVGPTASGKSGAAVAVARKLHGEVISADSRQIYRGLDIGTGKVTPKETRGVPHHLLDIANPKSQYTVVQFHLAARRAIQEIARRGMLPVLCGGTNLYMDTVLYGIRFPDTKKDAALRARLEKKTAAELFALLRAQDPSRAKTIDHKNKRRLIRALEIIAHAGAVPALDAPILSPDKKTLHWQSPYNACIIGIRMKPEVLRRRIDTRLIDRLKNGMIEEVEHLRKSGLSWKRLESFGLEYRYVALLLQKKLPRDAYGNTHQKSIHIGGLDTRDTTALYKILREKIWQYAKRQMTWLKRNPNIIWVKNSHEAVIVAQKHMKTGN